MAVETEATPKTPTPQQQVAASYDIIGGDEDTALEAAPPPKPAAIPPKPKHSARHLEEAREYGFDMALVEAATPEDLQAKLHETRLWLAREMRTIAAQDARREPLEAKNAPKPAQPAPPAVQPGAQVQVDDDFELDETWDPKLRTLAKTVKQLREENEGLKATVQRREVQDFDQIVDAAIDALPAKFKPLLGEGSLAEVIEAKNSKAQLRRMLIVNASGVLKGKFTPKKIHEMIRSSAEAVFELPDGPAGEPAAAAKPSLYAGGAAPALQPSHHSETQPRRPDGRYTREEWEAAAAARPTHRADAETPDGKKKATENLAKRIEEMGYSASGDATLDDFM